MLFLETKGELVVKLLKFMHINIMYIINMT